MLRRVRFPLLFALLAAGLLVVGPAAAADEPAPEPEAHAHAHDGEPRPAEEHVEREEEEAEKPFEVLVDAVYGFTTTDVATAKKTPPPDAVSDSMRASVLSLLVGAEAHLRERFTVGVRMPFVDANLESRTGDSDSVSRFAVGNVELEGAYLITKDAHTTITATLELALPTAGGTEPPGGSELGTSYKSYQSYAAVKAAGATRGGYESALFEPGNIGIVPKLSARFREEKVTFTPTVKLENLIAVKDTEEMYINELVGGARLAYLAHKHVEPGVHLWGSLVHEHTKTRDEVSGVGVVEPFVAVPIEPVRITASAILPFAGDLLDDKTIGVRLQAGAEF